MCMYVLVCLCFNWCVCVCVFVMIVYSYVCDGGCVVVHVCVCDECGWCVYAKNFVRLCVCVYVCVW